MEQQFITAIKLSSLPPERDYVRDLPVVHNLAQMRELAFPSPVTFFVGENGIGKSTLIEAIALCCGFNPEGGTRNFSFSTKNTHSDLWEHMTVVKSWRRPKDGFFLRAESFYNVSTNIDEMDEEEGLGAPVKNSYGGLSLHERSHGESFLAAVENRFGGNGLYILDEPEAALSPGGILRLMANMNELVRKGSQFIVSTHSPMLIAFPGATVYELTEEGITAVPYKQTAHYTTVRRFLENPESILRILFGE